LPRPSIRNPFIEFANGKDVVDAVKSAPATADVPADQIQKLFESFANPRCTNATARRWTPQVPISGYDPSTPGICGRCRQGRRCARGGGFRKDIGEIGRAVVETLRIGQQTRELHSGVTSRPPG